jgi:23S rRNA pseudouridine955/2504/2580 synthase
VVKVREDGKESQTRFAILEKLNGCTLVEAMPLTGRTHQIRVHAQHAGHPLLGDDKYGNDGSRELTDQLGLRRLFLHAAALTFTDPLDGEAVTVEAPLPDELLAIIDRAK